MTQSFLAHRYWHGIEPGSVGDIKVHELPNVVRVNYYNAEARGYCFREGVSIAISVKAEASTSMELPVGGIQRRAIVGQDY